MPPHQEPLSPNGRTGEMPRPADAMPYDWIDAAPRSLQPWLRLMRLDRPIGAILLFLPCVFGLALGAVAQGRTFGSRRDFALLALFAAGSLIMRGGGCTYNDIIDRDIDAQVLRTRGRPIPSGAVSLRGAWIFLALQCIAGLAVLVQFNTYSIVLGASSLVLIGFYPFMKRVTWWPQAWLGLTFNWGALLGFSAETAHLAPSVFLLYAGCFFWTLAYDTIYALQDKADDAPIGVRSTARLFGTRARTWIDVFYGLALLGMVSSLVLATSRAWLALLLLPAGLHFQWQTRRLDADDAQVCLRIFRSNRDAGLLIAAAIVAASYLR